MSRLAACLLTGATSLACVAEEKTYPTDHPDAIHFDYDDYDHTWDNSLQRPRDMVTWDYWFAVDPDKQEYHAFYLQFPQEIFENPATRKLRHKHQSVGHAISKDLKTWSTVSDALRPIPGTFNDEGIATASVCRRVEDGKWIMLFTSKGQGGFGLCPAISDDLIHWKKLPEHRLARAMNAEWQGKMYKGTINADPYIHPEKKDGYYWMSLNARMWNDAVAEDKQGGVIMLKSKDLLTWEDHKWIAFHRGANRCETTQHWEHNGKWYLYTGMVGYGPWMDNSYVLVSDHFDGPYEMKEWSKLSLPDGKRYYIGKQITAFDGKQYFLAGEDYTKLSAPYPISYGDDGRVILGVPE